MNFEVNKVHSKVFDFRFSKVSRSYWFFNVESTVEYRVSFVGLVEGGKCLGKVIYRIEYLDGNKREFDFHECKKIIGEWVESEFVEVDRLDIEDLNWNGMRWIHCIFENKVVEKFEDGCNFWMMVRGSMNDGEANYSLVKDNELVSMKYSFGKNDVVDGWIRKYCGVSQFD